jgi:hypothetical protein
MRQPIRRFRFLERQDKRKDRLDCFVVLLLAMTSAIYCAHPVVNYLQIPRLTTLKTTNTSKKQKLQNVMFSPDRCFFTLKPA